MSSIARALPPVCLMAIAAMAISGCNSTGNPPSGDGGKISGSSAADAFQRTVKPLFERRCVWCHSHDDPRAGLNVQDRTATLNPALRFIVPGEPDESRIYRAITLEGAHPGAMPGDGWGLTEEQRTAVRDWIAGGAPWPEGSNGRIRKKPVIIEHDDYR